MPTQIVLIAPENVDTAVIASVLDAADASAMIVPRRNMGESAYKKLVQAILPKAQQRDCAVLLEGEPGLVRMLGADGLHVEGTEDLVREAIDRLKPDHIVGARATSRDDAMAKGELGVDYILFGTIEFALDEDDGDLAGWWAETMEVPAVLSDPGADPETIDPRGCEFAALSDSLWNAKEGPVAAAEAFVRRLEAI
jgi:thiamine-phosphate pyrophosphorylase